MNTTRMPTRATEDDPVADAEVMGDRRGAAGLPPVVDLATAAELLGIGRTTAYQLVRVGEWPTRVLRLGRTIRIPTAELFGLLGLEPSVGLAVLPTFGTPRRKGCGLDVGRPRERLAAATVRPPRGDR